MPRKNNQPREYEFVIPERKEIMDFLRKAGTPCELKAIARGLKVKNQAQRGALGKRLAAMVRDGQLIRNRREGYGLLDKMDLIAGKVIGHPDGYGFVVPDSGEGGDLYLSIREMRSVLHGDRVAVRVCGVDKKDRREGKLVEVLERANQQVVGRYYREGPVAYVVPDNKRLSQDIIISSGKKTSAKEGDFVIVEILKQPDRHTQPAGKVVEVLGHRDEAGMAVEIAIRAFDLPHTWPREVEKETTMLDADAAPPAGDRLDLRELPFVTIDGADARDFDDAVYCEKAGAGWRLMVAIADVSHYVQPDSALDREAENRGTSVYFPGRVLPMLPEVLSNELCSLKPRVDRLAMVCEMQVSNKGKIRGFSFHEGIIRSAARLTYEAMADIAVNRDKGARKKYKGLLTALDGLYSLYQSMHRQRASAGLLEFDSSETQMSFDKHGRISRIDPVRRNDAHRLIEEFMLAANVCTARFLLEQQMPALFRNHDTPKAEKLRDLREFLGELGLGLGGGDDPEARHYAKLLGIIDGRPDAHMIRTILLRSLPLAVYENENSGHFGLAFDAYTHFTSPIRRYPDLLVHRAIRHLLRGRRKKSFPWSHKDMHRLAEHCSMTERRAEEASRDVEQRMKCEFMRERVGEVFDGTITSVTSFGLFVELDDLYVEGLVHVTGLPGDYYHFDAVGHRLKGERSGRSYRLAERIRVRVMRVSVDEKKVDFELAD